MAVHIPFSGKRRKRLQSWAGRSWLETLTRQIYILSLYLDKRAMHGTIVHVFRLLEEVKDAHSPIRGSSGLASCCRARSARYAKESSSEDREAGEGE